MHTFEGKYNTRIFYDGDYSGEAIVQDKEGNEIRVDARDLVAFGRCGIVDKVISMIENIPLYDEE